MKKTRQWKKKKRRKDWPPVMNISDIPQLQAVAAAAAGFSIGEAVVPAKGHQSETPRLREAHARSSLAGAEAKVAQWEVLQVEARHPGCSPAEDWAGSGGGGGKGGLLALTRVNNCEHVCRRGNSRRKGNLAAVESITLAGISCSGRLLDPKTLGGGNP